jgi:hypothetical protein
MPATSKQPRQLSDADLQQLLELTKGADSVELKVPDSERRSTVTALGMDPLDAQIRQVYFFDTSDLVSNREGVVVRARRVQGRGDDSVVKLRPVIPGEFPAGLRKSKNLVVEVAAMPGGYVCSAPFKGTLGTTDVQQVAAGKRAIRKLFSKEQRAFFTAHAPEGIGLDDLTMLGPITLLKLKFSPAACRRRLVAELWMYPTARGSWSCPPNTRPPRGSRSPPRHERSWPRRVWICPASSRPRPRRHSSTSPRT